MTPKKEKIRLVSLGCSKNTVDSEELLRQFQINNWDLAVDHEEADIAVINTCGFIEEAKHESLETILEAVRLKRQGRLRKVVVMGCLSERYARDLHAEIPEIDAIVGANKLADVVRVLGGNYKHELLGERLLLTPAHYAYLKISEGCDNPCSFCAIPLMRGKHTSRPIERILSEAGRLAEGGVKELILIAQDSTYYGLDIYGEQVLARLLRRLGEVGGIEWLRLMYAFPAKFPVDVLEEFRANPKLCRYIDIPFQHISDRVLRSMRRGISSRATRELIDTIRSSVPGVALRTTLIVGYPGEGEREFAELLRFVEETEFDRLGAFAYSQEEDTAAYALGDPVPRDVKGERVAAIMEAQQKISLRKNRAKIGRTMRILIDSRDAREAFGRSEYDAPEIDNEVTIHAAEGVSVGEFCDVSVVDAGEYDLFCELKKRGGKGTDRVRKP